jgi:hypothetical protein
MDPRRTSDEARRNRRHLAEVLRQVLPRRGLLVELGSGSGEHAVALARLRPELTWQPTDVDPVMCASCDAWTRQARLRNVRPAIVLDVARAPWPIVAADALLAIHVLPFVDDAGLDAALPEAARVLRDGAPLVVHGAFLHDGRAPSRRLEAYDRRLRAEARGRLVERRALEERADALGLWLAHRGPHDGDLDTLVFRKVPVGTRPSSAPAPLPRRPWWRRWAP